MNTEFGIDLDEVRRVIDAADVLVVRFTITDRRLLVDCRTSDTEGPMVRVVPPVASGEERFKALKIMRPRFRTPERILTFQWPRHAVALAEAGVWDHLVRKVTGIRAGAAEQCSAAWHELLGEERKTEVAAVRGDEGFKTIWPRGGDDG
jgi:hypothetical protein